MTSRPATTADPSVRREPFGSLHGTPVSVYTLDSGHGMVVRIMEYGGVVLSIQAPGRDGRSDNVTLGYRTLAEYCGDTVYAGALIGRYANRIALARFRLDGRDYALGRNDGPNHLHGGTRGFHRVVWHGEPLRDEGAAGVLLRHVSPAGLDGYPGALTTTVRCTLSRDHALAFEYHATTDAPTPVSLTQHSYFNLAGRGAADAGGHELTIRASRYLPVGSGLIPVGELRDVEGTPFDFRRGAIIGERLRNSYDQLKIGRGFDHCFALDGGPGAAARLRDPASGRVLDIETTLPALQFYSSGALPSGWSDGPRCGVALEAQQFPDAPNQPAFAPAILRPGEAYAHRIVYRFSVA